MPPNDVDANFTVSANGTTLTLAELGHDPAASPSTRAVGGAFIGRPGPNAVSDLGSPGQDDNPLHTGTARPCINPPGPAGNPCGVQRHGGCPSDLRRHDRDTPGAVGRSVPHVRRRGFVDAGVPGRRSRTWRTSSGGGTPASPHRGLPDGRHPVGAQDRHPHDAPARRPAGNQTARCDPNFAQGQEFSAFRYGCQPWYGENRSPTAPGGTRRRRSARESGILSPTPTWPSIRTRTRSGTRGGASPGAWPLEPARSATEWPSRRRTAIEINPARLSARTSTALDRLGNYDGKPEPMNPTGSGWLGRRQPDLRTTRASSICSSSRTRRSRARPAATRRQTVPILGFASFYVMNWTGQNNPSERPVPRSGPSPDSSATSQIASRPAARRIPASSSRRSTTSPAPSIRPRSAIEGQLTPCRASLVR